jgi:hypothetical protein
MWRKDTLIDFVTHLLWTHFSLVFRWNAFLCYSDTIAFA